MAKRKNINRRKPVKQEESLRVDFREVAKLVVVALVVIVGLWAAKQIDDISIKTIEIQSALDKVNKDDVKTIAQNYMRDGFFTANLAEFENQLNDIPWVYRATIKREWPGKVVIQIIEQQPYFRWGSQHLINKYAQVFYVGDTQAYSQLPLLKGTKGREKKLINLYYKYNKEFEELGAGIVSFEEDARYDKKLTLKNGITINLGRGLTDVNIQRCLHAFAMFTNSEREAIKRIDFRHSNGFAVSWNG